MTDKPLDPELERFKGLLEQRRSLLDQKNRDDRRKLLLKAFSAFAGLLLLSSGVFFSLSKVVFPLNLNTPPARINEITGLRAKIAQLELELANSRVANDVIQRTATAIVKDMDSKQLYDRLATIEAAILQTPEKALTIPLVRQEIADAVKRNEENAVRTRAELDRVYNQQNWILNLLCTAAVSLFIAVIGGSIGFWVKYQKSSKTS